MSIKSAVRAVAAALTVVLGSSLLRWRLRRSRLTCGAREAPLHSTPVNSKEGDTIMATKRYEYVSVTVTPEKNPVLELNSLGANGYRVVATTAALLILERKVKAEDKDDEDEDEDG